MSIHDRDLLTGKTKLETSIERIRTFCTGKRVLVAFSGGKDSQCCYHLCRDAGIDFEAQYSITRFEPPELIAFIRKHYPDVTFRRAYKKSLVEQIADIGLPNRWVRWCCESKHRKTPGFDICVIGVRWQESARRRMRWTMFGHKKDGSAYVCPICDWTHSDVWEYLNGKGLPHCRLYDEGYKRIGCVCCPLVASRNTRDIERYPKFVNMLRLGFLKRINRMDYKKETTRKIMEKYRRDPELYFNNWLKYGSTEAQSPSDINYEPCLFAGTGFSESDGTEGEQE